MTPEQIIEQAKSLLAGIRERHAKVTFEDGRQVYVEAWMEPDPGVEHAGGYGDTPEKALDDVLDRLVARRADYARRHAVPMAVA